MAIYTLEERTEIILTNPNKDLMKYADTQRKRFMLHVHGEGLNKALKDTPYLEGDDFSAIRKSFALSNQDLIRRLLINESQVFTTTGGSATYGLPEDDEKQMRALMDNVIYGYPLSKWIEIFALDAYRCDPMGVIFMECDELIVDEGQIYATPKCYPTYKSSSCIHDYLPNGRRLEYICFKLSEKELKQCGLAESDTSSTLPGIMKDVAGVNAQSFFRFVDDSEDVIYELKGDKLVAVSMRQKNPIPNEFGRVPGFIVSDLMQFNNPQAFGSPLQFVGEILDSFMEDRSVRELHKKLHGFPKAYEPLFECETCGGEGVFDGKTCPSCAIPGFAKGTGYKLRTRPADVARFPLNLLDKDSVGSGFDVKKLMGYVGMPVESLDKMDLSLIGSEGLIYHTYWGTKQEQVVAFNGRQQADVEETATKSLIDEKPILARLNATADWKDSTETLICDFIGTYYFGSEFTGAGRTSGRDYSVESPQKLMEMYLKMTGKGFTSPITAKDDTMVRYIRSLYQSNRPQLALMLKFYNIELFPDYSPEQIQKNQYITLEDKVMYNYQSAWKRSLTETQQRLMSAFQLVENRKKYTIPLIEVVRNEIQQAATLEANAKQIQGDNLN